MLNIADPVGPPVLDPHKDGSYQSSGMVLTIMYEGLLIRDDKGELRPQLAETWKAVSPTVHEFKIRRSVTFHNGREMEGHGLGGSAKSGAESTGSQPTGSQPTAG